MTVSPSERDPLLSRQPSLPENHDSSTFKAVGPRHLGPLEISATTRYGILAGVWSATFLSCLNQTLVPTMLPSISSEFNKSNQASWLGTAYLLATCTFTPLYGRLSNVLGRQGACLLALCCFGVGILGCGFSTNMEMLIVARFISGIGGGGLFTTSSIIISDMYSMRTRGLAQGLGSVFNGLGLGFGGPFGGFVTDWLGWRGAFLIQIPLFILSFGWISYFLCYVTPGKGKSTKDVLKRIDYGGSTVLLITVGSVLIFLSSRYNEGLPWSHPTVIAPLAVAGVGAVSFILIELFVAPEPVLAPALLRQKIPVLVGMSNFLVATCNFAIMYFFPMWFQTVMLTSASTAGLHLMPNSIGISVGSVFAGYVMHRTGKYKTLSAIFGILPFIGATLISRIRDDSGPLLTWLCIFPLGFGNAVVLQTMLIALLVHLPESQMAVGTGFGQLFRGVGQVGGVAIASALFQSKLDGELRKRITTPDAEEIIMKIRHSARLVASLPPELQTKARESYAVSLKAVFSFAAVSTLMAFIVRIPIPDKDLDQGRPKSHVSTTADRRSSSLMAHAPEEQIRGVDSAVADEEDEDDEYVESDEMPGPGKGHHHRRRLSTYESADEFLADQNEREERVTRSGTEAV